MFVSANSLAINYGLDEAIAKFFVDRQPPANNLYWNNKLLYLRPEPGYLFIPLMVDLLYKSGIDTKHLLSEKFVGLMEQIGHVGAEEELKIITADEAMEKYIGLANHQCVNERYFNDLVAFIKGETDNVFAKAATPYKALHRGDAFLFSLCALHFDDTLQSAIVKYWFALISTLLLLDDAEDIEIDSASGDLNAFLESGLNREGIDNIRNMVRDNLRLISTINKSMANTLDKKYMALAAKPHIQQLLNQ